VNVAEGVDVGVVVEGGDRSDVVCIADGVEAWAVGTID
jgi:hypothetical protein